MISDASRPPEPSLPRLRAGDRRFAVALSFPGELRETALAMAEDLAGTLGRQRVFYDRYYQAELARPDSDLYLQTIYHDHSELIVVFLAWSYEQKDWCGLEWRAIRDLIKKRQSDRVMLLRFDDAEIAGIFSTDITVDARGQSPEELSRKIMDRLEARPHEIPVAARELARPGLLRHLLDRTLPGLHLWLTRLGSFSEPREMADLHSFLRDLNAGIVHDDRQKNFLPLDARVVPHRATPEAGGGDPFVRPVQQLIRQVTGLAEGGDSASAQIAAVDRRSRLVKDIVKTLLTAHNPLVLLGDPGSGKTMALQQAAITLAGAELGRAFPIVPVYLRLGELHVEGEVGTEQIAAFVRRSAPRRIQPWLDSLDHAGRLVLLFDGMDEMSRERYNQHTEALSAFAESRRGRTKTLFSCRITDFSPSFIHRRLVLLPFNRSQIRTYLYRYFAGCAVMIDGQTWSITDLARRLSAGDLPVEPSNPFELSLLCRFLQAQKAWPASRVELMRYYHRKNYERKRRDAEKEGVLFPKPDEAFRSWAQLAFTITERNRGAAIAVTDLVEGLTDRSAVDRILQRIRIGKACGVLHESIEGTLHAIRFDHHRLQEYFTALHILKTDTPVDWLSRLDAPRWQETMINLVLMGGAENGVIALAEAVANANAKAQGKREEPATDDQDKAPVTPKIPHQEESLLADRIEIGARLLQHGERTSRAVQEHLKPALRSAVDLLVERGKPITQVKMMRACQRSTDLDLLKALEKPLRSPVHWVRDQALILVAASRPGSRGAGADLATEMGFDLATNKLLPRWFAYLKAVLAAGRLGAWWSFLLATWFGLLSLLVSITGGYLAYAGGGAALKDESGPLSRNLEVSLLFDHPGVQLFVAALVCGLVLLIFKSESSRLWLLIPVCTFSGMVLAVTGKLLWEGQLSAVLLLILPFFFATLVYYLVALPFALIHSLLLILYLTLTRGVRAPGQALSSFVSLAWREGDFAEPAGSAAKVLGFVFAGMLVVGAGIAAAPLARDSPFLFLVALLPVLGLLGLLAARSIRGRLLAARARGRLKSEAAEIRAGLSVKGVLKMLGGFLAVSLLAEPVAAVGSFLLDLFEKGTERVGLGLKPLGGCFAYIALFVIAGVFVVFAGLVVHRLSRTFRIAFPRRPYPPGTFTPERWREILLEASPYRQENLLLRTSHQSLGLRTEELVELLRDVEHFVCEEPALSVYWDRLDQLEQALKQERQG